MASRLLCIQSVLLAVLTCMGFACTVASRTSPALPTETPPTFDLAPGHRVQLDQDPFDYFTNPWTVIGLTDYVDGTRVGPAFELLLADGLVVRPMVHDRSKATNSQEFVPLDYRVKKTLRGGYLPIVQTRFSLNGAVSYMLEAFACPMDPTDRAAYDRPQDNYLNLLRITAENQPGGWNLAEFALPFVGKSGKLAGKPGDASSEEGAWRLMDGSRVLAVVQHPKTWQVGFTDGRIHVYASPSSRQPASLVVCIPFRPIDTNSEEWKKLGRIDFDTAAHRATMYWNDLLNRGARLSLPEEKVLNTYKASMMYQFIGRDKNELHPGEGFYDEVFIRDNAYQAISLAQAGYLDEAQQSLEATLRFQRDNGQFWSQPDQFDANGYAVWAFVEFYRLSGDKDWLRKVYPNIQRSVAWIREARRIEKDPASPFFGILPPSIADGENMMESKHHIVGYDWWNLRAVQHAAIAAEALGLEQDVAEYRKEFEDYRQAVLKAMDRTGLAYIPPSFEKVGTHWGNLEVIFPSRLIEAQDKRLGETLRLVHDEFGPEAGPRGFVEGIIQWDPLGNGRHAPAIHPYMSQFVTNTHIIRGEREQALDGFYSFLLHTTSTNGFPEGVLYQQKAAWGNTLPHLWAAALYVTTLRNMLIREEGDTLHLLSCVPDHWLEKDGIAFWDAPTYFGTVGLTARTVRGVEPSTIRLALSPQWRQLPARVIIHAPLGTEITTASQGGHLMGAEKGALVVPGELFSKGGAIELHFRRTGSPVMTFLSRVAAFEAAATKPAP